MGITSFGKCGEINVSLVTLGMVRADFILQVENLLTKKYCIVRRQTSLNSYWEFTAARSNVVSMSYTMFGCQIWQALIYVSPTYTILSDHDATKLEINPKNVTKAKWLPGQNKTLKTIGSEKN